MKTHEGFPRVRTITITASELRTLANKLDAMEWPMGVSIDLADCIVIFVNPEGNPKKPKKQ